jgi:hypothetical protein
LWCSVMWQCAIHRAGFATSSIGEVGSVHDPFGEPVA